MSIPTEEQDMTQTAAERTPGNVSQPWPTRPDGSNKTVGEMTPAERKQVFTDAAARLKDQFEHPAFRAALAKLEAGQ